MAKETASSSSEPENTDELEQITIARALLNYRIKEKMGMSYSNTPIPFPKKFQIQSHRPTSPQPPPFTTSKILPFICQRTSPRSRPSLTTANESPRRRAPLAATASDNSMAQSSAPENRGTRPPKFPAVGAAPYVPIQQMRLPCRGIAPPVNVRTAVPVFSAPPLPPPAAVPHPIIQAAPVRVAPAVTIRQAIPVYAAPPVRKDEPARIPKEDPVTISAPCQQDVLSAAKLEDKDNKVENTLPESQTVQSLEQLKI